MEVKICIYIKRRDDSSCDFGDTLDFLSPGSTPFSVREVIQLPHKQHGIMKTFTYIGK